ncbi:MAG: hypothetical protein QOC77_3708 [Thermoleophilaceae bacterium]|nr:hypothetical protein [Thermoleophilaceae bacterium]
MRHMPTKRFAQIAVPLALAAALAAGCGGSSSGGGSGSKPAASSSSSSSGGALAADANSAATGDIPDNQNFLTFKGAGFSMQYPEGWSQKTTASGVTFQDKNNLVRVDVKKGKPPTVASVTAELAKLKASSPSLKAPAPKPFKLKAGPAIKVTYTTTSAPNPVTGKRVTLTVDRYVVGGKGKVAMLDLGTPVGVDNVDAYRMMSASFKWL